MNGSRSNTPRAGLQSYGDRSSLDALNRTIEGLEARIEGLMGTAARPPRTPPPMEREVPAARHDPIAEIMQRQRTLSATRERDILRDRGAQTRGYDDRREAQSPISSERDVPVAPHFSEGLRSEQFRREPLRSEPLRSEPLRSEPLRSEPRRSERQDTPRQEFPRREPRPESSSIRIALTSSIPTTPAARSSSPA